MKDYFFHNLDEEEVLKLNTDLRRVISSHIAYFSKILPSIMFRGNGDLPKHNAGILDEWVFSVDSEIILNNHRFLALKATTGVYKNILIKMFKKLSRDIIITEKEFLEFKTSYEFITKSLMEIQNDLMETKFQFDPLTGAINRRAFDVIIKNERLSLIREDGKSCIAFADIDFFKNINDKHGHSAGDIVLKEIVTLFRRNIRETDVVARWGGEEFIILIQGASVQVANKVVEKVRKKIEQNIFKVAGKEIKVTCSFGISEMGSKTVDQAIDDADAAVYRAKETGRNKTIVKV